MSPSQPSARPRYRAAILAGAVLLAVAVAPASAASPSVAGPSVAGPSVAGGGQEHTVVVGSRGDFVAQANFVQCVGASMQMMLNMIQPGRDRSAKTQSELQRLARSWSGPRPDGGERQGASVRGWAAGLNLNGAGPYRLVGESTLQAALRTAARAIATTGKPVGLLVWRGRHAWVMSGFTATADPLRTDRFDVTRAVVHDPLYPHGSAVWGPSPKPGASLTPKQVGRQFVPRRMSTRWLSGYSALAGKYVLVLPYEIDLSIYGVAAS
jgi:hypothetical protein